MDKGRMSATVDNYEVWSDWSPGAVNVSGKQRCKDEVDRQPVEIDVRSESHRRTYWKLLGWRVARPEGCFRKTM